MFEEKGDALYGEEVTQKEHALQAAWLAEKAREESFLIVAALLHDVGHLLTGLPEEAAHQGIDDKHEEIGQRWLEKYFSPEVTETVRLHVAAKRYLCATDSHYYALLSPASQLSLDLQGGAFSPGEVEEFESNPYYQEAVKLRQFDDESKNAGLATPDLSHFRPYLEESLAKSD